MKASTIKKCKWNSKDNILFSTPGPCLMQIHLVQNSTSARYEKKSQNIHLMWIYSTSANFTYYYSLSAKIHTKWIIGCTSWIN